MRKSSEATDFKIHEDSSCMTDIGTDMSAERVASSETIIHHDSSEVKPTAEGPEADEHNANRERQIDRIEAKIQAAARAVVESIEDDYRGNEDSVLSARTDESYEPEGTELTYGDGTELTYGDGTEAIFESDDDYHSQHEQHEQECDSSSHHDGDIDDDVFSPNSGRSARSSLNSCDDLHPSEAIYQKELTSPSIGEEADHHDEDTMSRISSVASYLRHPSNDTPGTPTKTFSRPPFRTPSSVRALQMSSPAPSIFSSPRSSKRHAQSMSRMSTPTSHSKNKTPTRFKFKTEKPLVLLHVTVLPLRWPYSHIMSSIHLPSSLQQVKDNWRLLQDKLGDTVLERGILLPHPQDSYEVLEERLLEALELPMRPRARILKCGHYIGPSDSSTSDDESDAQSERESQRRGYCDICSRDYSFEDYGPGASKKQFRIKFFAGNGLMTGGAWAAAWREMERVDVEIEPFVEAAVVGELEQLVMIHKAVPEMEEVFVTDDEEAVPQHGNEETREEENRRREEEEATLRKEREEARMREIYGEHIPPSEPERPRSSKEHVSRHIRPGDSLPELLLAAIKVAMRDQKNLAICLLSLFVLFLALKPGSGESHVMPSIKDVAPMPDVVTHFVTETVSVRESVPTVDVVQKQTGNEVIGGAEVESQKREVGGPVEAEHQPDEAEYPASLEQGAMPPPVAEAQPSEIDDVENTAKGAEVKI